ncbi:MAG TPA: HAD family hydrolase [Candidatus Hydrogenedentes bacterium]|nr:HAD family hydrolase [Candidatus Hydrogenedentota bacterium]
MTFDATPVKAVVFDYGNTLIAFGREQVDQFDALLLEAVTAEFGPPDPAQYKARRDADRMFPYQGDPPSYRENDVREMTAGLIREVYGVEPSGGALDRLIAVRQEAFVRVVRVEPETLSFLRRLGAKYRLALLSNYPDGDAIRASLDDTGIAPFLEHALVSGDLGLCKPHPDVFRAVLDALALPPEAVLFVGDNWLADVQGARRAGMQVAHFRRWIPPEHFPEQPGDVSPHVSVATLGELLPLLRV